MPMELLVTLVLALPIAGFGLTALVGRRLGTRAWIVAVPAIVVTWALALVVVWSALSGGFGADGLHFTLYEWVPAGDFTIEANFAVDNLTAVLLIVVTTVGMLVHVYSIGYMAHDPGRWRFFAYLNLFMFSMLLLVLAGNFMLLFAAWELVGLCSYLLIGFWYPRPSAAIAAKKAFLANRVGDVGFALGIFAVWTTVGTLNFTDAFERLSEGLAGGQIEAWGVTGIAPLLFCGAVGKSAQFPLHVWLPDAMEGPTPVSALIHAATMVNAGVYFVARANPLFSLSPEAMFASLGVGAYVAAIFHMTAQGFTKGLLFLGSGSVIHGVHEEQDMNRMGGLWRRMPITHATMLVGSLSMAGIPPLAAFFSKDEILGEAFKNGFLWVWLVGIVVAALTAFYMFRLMGKTFYGPSHVDPTVEPHIRESPRSMTVPLVLLAIPAALLGLVLGLPFGAGLIGQWLEPIFEEAQLNLGLHHEPVQILGIDGVLILVSVAVATAGLAVAIRLFGFHWPLRGDGTEAQPERVAALTARAPRLYQASFRKWWFDELNDLLFVRLGGRAAHFIWWFDRAIVDGTVNGIGDVVQSAGRDLRRIQTGRVQNYALGIAVALIVMAGGFLIVTAR